MRLTMTVVDPRGPVSTPRHVTVEATAGTTFGELRPRLAAVVGTDDAAFTVADRVLADTDEVGVAPLLRGALLRVSIPGDEVVRRAGRGVVALRVAAGPGAGRTFALGRGEHVVGRATSAAVRLDDPGVSRTHAVVEVAPEGITVRDLTPTNRSRIDDSPLPPEGARLASGGTLHLGSTTLVLGVPAVRRGHHAVVEGEVRIHRQPRLRDPAAAPRVTFPEAPTRPERHRMPLLTSLAPLVLSAALAVVLSSPALLLFALMSPVLLLGQWWSDRRAGRVSHRRRLREHATEVEQARARLADALATDATRRHTMHPDLGHVEAVVRRRGDRLWERRPADGDHLVLRLGAATQPSGVEVDGPAPDGPARVAGLPAVVDLARAGVVGVAGRRDHVLSLTGALVLQLATWHTPRDLTLHVLADTDERARDWEWAAFLPHARDDDGSPAFVAGGSPEVLRHVAGLRRLVESRLAVADGPWAGGPDPAPDLVVVLDGASTLRAHPGVAELLADGPRAGIAFVCLDRDTTSLPAETRASVQLGPTGLDATVREDGRVLADVVPDLPSLGWLEEVARELAPCVDATPDGGTQGLPRTVSFVELHRAAGTDPTTAEGLARSWAASTGRPVALLGRSAEGPVTLDLAAQGPHVLVGGTTGSGKSELLLTLVTGLAVTNRPDELALLLVDHKGGSAFSECARLPHTVGLVTDLDAHLTARALTSLQAEMKRRERLLARASARDLDEYRSAAAVCRDLPTLARLVVVVDEFKALADEFPDFIAGLVRVAALGRSLGLHLVLATQRPAGIVSADMRANIALRIALRVRDRADSEDVVDSPAAASLDPRAPGRACLRPGDAGLTTVQTAHLGRPSSAPGPAASVLRVVERDLLAPVATVAPVDAPGTLDQQAARTELHEVVEAARAAARDGGVRTPPSPWLPPLPTSLTAAEARRASGPDEVVARVGDVPWAVVDVPDEQRRETLWWRADEAGHLGIAGGPRSGRSFALAALALGVGDVAAQGDLHVHVLQGAAGPCAALERLPWVGTVTDAGEPRRTRRLLSRLLRLVDGDETGPRRTLVLVDGWETVEESLAGVDHGGPVEDLLRLLRDGPAAGVRFAVAGGRAVLSGRLPGLLDRRVALHLPDPLDLTLAGVSPALASVDRPPGRGVDLRTGRELQVVLPGSRPEADAAGTAAAVADAVDDTLVRLAAGAGTEGAAEGAATDNVRPWRVADPPERVAVADLPSPPGPWWVGIGGDDATPVALPTGPGHQRLLVAGPPRSGRSCTLVALGERLVAHGRHVAVVAPRRSPLTVWAAARDGVVRLEHRDADELVAVRRADPDLCLLVDDVELVDGSAAEAPLLEMARLLDDTDGLLVVAAELARANGAFRGLVPELSRDGVGIVLGAASPTDGDVLGVRLDPGPARRPGRGHLVAAGWATPLQVALLEPDPLTPATTVDGAGVRPPSLARS